MRSDGEPVGGRFRIERIVGAGGMGTVYRALDLETSAIVALKLLITRGPSDLERFARESRLLAEMRHPNHTEPRKLAVWSLRRSRRRDRAR